MNFVRTILHHDHLKSACCFHAILTELVVVIWPAISVALGTGIYSFSLFVIAVNIPRIVDQFVALSFEIVTQ